MPLKNRNMAYPLVLVALALAVDKSNGFLATGNQRPVFSTTRSAQRSINAQRVLATVADDVNIKPNPKPLGEPEDHTVAVFGATGYIGKFVVRDLVRKGYKTIAVVRDSSVNRPELEGAEIVVADPTDVDNIAKNVFAGRKIDAVMSCLASRSGTPKDSYMVDYQATSNTLKAAVEHKQTSHYVLLSAYCVKTPLLHFQNAKLKFESELVDAPVIHSIVRPTAFFKSLSGQFELVKQGWPFVLFGTGEDVKCNPIAEADLADLMSLCLQDTSRQNKVLNVGGPDDPLTLKRQAEMMFEVLGKEPAYWSVPIGLFDAIINTFDFFAKFLDGAKDAAELSRIGKYYAVEDMLTTAEEEKYGTVTLMDHYRRIDKEGQEYDPYTTMFASKKTE